MKRVEATNGGCDNEIRQQQQSADGCQPSRVEAGSSIDSAAVWEMFADPDVIDADQARQRANRQQVGQGSITNRRDAKADDVGFAGAPIAIEQRGGPDPTHIAWPADSAD